MKRLSKFLIPALVLSLVALAIAPIFAAPSASTSAATALIQQASTQQQEYWGSAKSDKFHYPTCQWAKKIKAANLIIFKSRDEAPKARYVPCKVCKP